MSTGEEFPDSGLLIVAEVQTDPDESHHHQTAQHQIGQIYNPTYHNALLDHPPCNEMDPEHDDTIDQHQANEESQVILSRPPTKTDHLANVNSSGVHLFLFYLTAIKTNRLISYKNPNVPA